MRCERWLGYEESQGLAFLPQAWSTYFSILPVVCSFVKVMCDWFSTHPSLRDEHTGVWSVTLFSLNLSTDPKVVPREEPRDPSLCFFSLGSTRVWIQGFILGRQALYHLGRSVSPFWYWLFFEIGSWELFAQAGFKPQSSWSLPPE
jgi:hypothetical protein